jgi:hypothetical protein
MKKTFLAILYFVSLSVCLAYTEEFDDYITIESIPYYESGKVYAKQMGMLEKGEKIKLEGTIMIGQIDVYGESSPCFFFIKDNERYLTYFDDKIIPIKSKAYFSEDILADSGNWHKNLFLPSYYWDVVRTNDRGKMLDYEPGILPNYFDGKDEVYWFEHYTAEDGESKFYNSAVQFQRDFFLIVKNIVETPSGYSIDFVNSKTNRRRVSERKNTVHYAEDIGSVFNVSEYNWDYLFDSEPLSLIVIFDGDYLDLYVNDLSRKLITLVRADEEFVAQFNQFIKTKTCDLTNVRWPRRADGSMDYPPPETPAQVTSFLPENGYTEAAYYRTVDNLRLRSSPNAQGEILKTLLKGEQVQALESGLSAVIDGIRAPWVRVETEDGVQGWCFAGYLEPAPEAAGKDTPGEAAGEGALPHDSGNAPEESVRTSESRMPFLGIAAALLALGAAVVIIVLRMRKKRC